MGSYASLMNNTPWPVFQVCLQSALNIPQFCLNDDAWECNWSWPSQCYDADSRCLLPRGTFPSGKWTVKHPLRTRLKIVGDYDTWAELGLTMWTGGTPDSVNHYLISDAEHGSWRCDWHSLHPTNYHDVARLLNQITGLKNATEAGLNNGAMFVSAFNSSLNIVPKIGAPISVIDRSSGKESVAIIDSINDTAEEGNNMVNVTAVFGVFNAPFPITAHSRHHERISFMIDKNSLNVVASGRGSVKFDDLTRAALFLPIVGKPYRLLFSAKRMMHMVTNILSASESPATRIDYGLIGRIVFRETVRANAEDNFAHITADTNTAIEKFNDALNHFRDGEKTHYVEQLKSSGDHAHRVYNRVAEVGFPAEFEWWRPISYMQLVTVRLIALLNLHAVEVTADSNSVGFLQSARECSRHARNSLDRMINDSNDSVKQWTQEIASNFESSDYRSHILSDYLAIIALKLKFENEWDNVLMLFD